MKMASNRLMGRLVAPLALLACAALLSACGGGNPGSTGSGTGTGTGTGTDSSTSVSAPKLTLALVDGAGAAVSTLSGGQSALLRATVTTATGAPAADAIVSFAASTSSLVEFTPASASALTDATGVAVISVKPASLTAAGAVAITASAVVDTKTATGTKNMAIGAAPLTVGTLAFAPAPVGALPAFSTAVLNIPVTSGGQAATSVTGLTLNSLCVGDGKATLVPGTLSNGIQTATYTNKGCTRGTDVITVSIGSSASQISLSVSAASINTVQYVGSNITGSSIVLKGSGGLGRSESAQLTFRVVDQQNNGLAGVNVNFTATTYTGGLTVLPASGTTDSNGNVSTTVSSGTIPTPVQVIAQATSGGQTISGLSNGLTISTGLPIQRFMSMSVDKYNIEGWSRDGEVANVTVRMADQYGNPVSDNTAINFVTEGGAVASSLLGACVTVNGGCTVALTSQDFRPANGRVTVLAYAQGIKDFVDTNGDGQYSCTNFKDPSGAVPATYRPLIDTCVSGGESYTPQGDAFLDAGVLGAIALGGATLDGVYDPANRDLPFPYNHSTYTSADSGAWGITYIRRSAEVTFSGSNPTLIRQQCASGTCRDWTAADGPASVIQGVAGVGCANKLLTFRLVDLHNNPMPASTTLSGVDADKLSTLTFSPDTVTSTNAIGGTMHSVIVKADSTCSQGSIGVKVMTPNGTGTVFGFTSQ
jgi:hypothetical protein